MTSAKTAMLQAILSLQSVSEEEKKVLMAAYKDLEKAETRNGFKLQRLMKDKVFAEEILNATIRDLQVSKQELEKANEQLEKQKEELKEQALIIEEKSLELIQSLQKLEFSYNELEQFSYIASHDLKTPLRTIGNFARLLQRRYKNKLDKEADEFIEFIMSGVQQMNNVIQHSLEYALTGKKDLIHQDVSLNEVMKIVFRGIETEIKASHAELFMMNLPTVIGDKIALVNLFQNLLSNAIKFCPEKKPHVEITTNTTAKYYEIRVKDNGIGIEEAYRNKIFRPFKRIGVGNVPGAGIGLAICKKIVHQHGGEINFESEVGVGTTFIVTFPRKDAIKEAPSAIEAFL